MYNYIQFGFVTVTNDNKPYVTKQGIGTSTLDVDQLQNNKGYIHRLSIHGTNDQIGLLTSSQFPNIQRISSSVKLNQAITEFTEDEDKQIIFGLKVDMKSRKMYLYCDGEEIGETYSNLPDKIIPAVYLESPDASNSNICSIEETLL